MMTREQDPESHRFISHIGRRVDVPFRWSVWVLGALAVGMLGSALSAWVLGGLALYALSNVALMLFFWQSRQPLNAVKWVVVSLYVVDLAFVTFLVYYTGGISSDLYLLYCFLVFKASVYYAALPSIIFLSFLFAPLYVLALYLAAGSLFFIREWTFFLRYLLLTGTVFAGLYTAWLVDARQRRVQSLYKELVGERDLIHDLNRHMDQERQQLEAVLSSIGDGVIVADAQRRLLMINPVAKALLEPAAVGGTLGRAGDHQKLDALLGEALGADVDASLTAEITLEPGGGKRKVIYEALASPVVDADRNRQGVVVVLRNVTEQRELEAIKSNFMSVISHELNTPLHAIRGFMDVILTGKTGPINATQRDFLETASEQAQHLQGLIDDLLNLAELDTGQIGLYLQPLPLGELIDEVVAELEPLAEQTQISLEVCIPSDLPLVRADRARLQQVLRNLLGNALKFTPGPGTVSIVALDSGADIRVEVSDTGIGVPADERERIFEFHQVDSSNTRPYRGAGLGLAICKRIVQAHEGQIWVTANEPQGSTFCFTLPKWS